MYEETAYERVLDRVRRWEGIEVIVSEEGQTEISVQGHEIGRIDRKGRLEISINRTVRDQLLTEGRADRHPEYPRSGWVTYQIRSEQDVEGSIWLLRLAYLCYLLGRRKVGQDIPQGVDLDVIKDRLRLSTDMASLIDRTYQSKRDEPQPSM